MIKNILFDLGHVIIDIDFERTIRAFRMLGKQDFQLSLDPINSIFIDFEVGLISDQEFIQYWLDNISGSNETIIIHAWNNMLIGIKPEIFSILDELKKNYDLFIYSNTNAIHIQWVRAYLKREYRMDDWVPNIFKTAYYSHELGFRKPDKRGFNLILEKENMLPEETLFIDDHLPNIQAALELGIKCIHKLKHRSLHDTLRDNRLI